MRAGHTMEHLSFELKVISCRDIKAFNFFQKPSVYAVVSVFDDELKKKKKKERQRHKTPVDRGGGRNPEWNHTMQIDMKATPLDDSGIFSHLYLQFQIFCEGIGFGDRNIGEVRVPFKDLIDEFDGNIRFLSYQIRTKDGKPNGVLNFSYIMNGTTKKIRTANHLVPEKVHRPSMGVLHKQQPCLFPEKIHPPSVGVLHKQESCLFPEKVHYPSADVLLRQTSEICYPSLGDIHPSHASPIFPNQAQEFNSMNTWQSPPSPAFPLKIDPPLASPLFYYCPSPAQEFYSMSTPQSPSPAFPTNHGPYHLPFPCTSSGYSPEPINHGYHLRGY